MIFQHLKILVLMLSTFIVPSICNTCDEGQTSICSDCFSVFFCYDSSELPCRSDEPCEEQEVYAFCNPDPDLVPACKCPNEVPSLIADPYNPEGYIDCKADGSATEVQCDPGLVWSQEELNCTIESTTTNPSSTPGSCEPFSCSDFPSVKGYVSDNQNCSVFHFCVNGSEPGSPLVCPEGEVFNPDTSTCTSDISSVKCPTPCTDTNVPTCSASQTVICYDCFTLVTCEGLYPIGCSAGQVCEEEGNFSYCTTNVTAVPACQCPSEVPANIADPYDPSKYIDCEKNGAYIRQCQTGLIWDQNIEQCVVEIYTTTMSTTSSVTCIPGTTAIDCTYYAVTKDDCSVNYKECKDGQVFNEETLECEQYFEFSCSNHTVNGYYSDTSNCSVFHLCIDEVEPGSPFVCPSGTVYDESGHKCTDDLSSVECPNPCTPPDIPALVDCSDGVAFVPVDCHTYYGCEEIIPGTDVYVPVLETCPEGLVVNVQLLACTPPLTAPYCMPTDPSILI